MKRPAKMVWPPHLAKAGPLLERAIAHTHGTHKPADVLAGIAANRLQVWIGEHSAAVTEVLTFPQFRAINVFLCAGEHAELERVFDGMAAWARGAGCSKAMFSGRLDPNDGRRSGWERLFPAWTPAHVTLWRDL